MEYPIRWWQRQASKIGPAPCPKCRAVLPGGEYVVDTSGDGRYKTAYRAIVERCRMCGWSYVHFSQEQGGSVVPNIRPRGLRPVGYDRLSDDEADRVLTRSKGRPVKKVVKLPGAKYKRKAGYQPIDRATIE